MPNHPSPAARRRHWPHLRDTPEAIGRGLAIGAFVSVTPTIGLQSVIAALLATAFRASRPAAVIPVWITNPVTIPAVFGFTYQVGCRIWPGPPSERVFEVLRGLVRQLRAEEPWDIAYQLQAVSALGRDIAIPLWIGGLLVGLVMALAVYPVAVALMRRSRRDRRQPAPPLKSDRSRVRSW